jgi:hypothetical protein
MSKGNKPQTLKRVVTSEDGAALRATFVFLHDYRSHDWEMRMEADGGLPVSSASCSQGAHALKVLSLPQVGR